MLFLRAYASRSVKASAVQQSSVVLRCPTERATRYVASALAQKLFQGDCYCLFGDVGAGKSAFSRAFIRAAYDDPYLPVPSPTFLLQNIYDDVIDQPPIHHFDLYRLSPEAKSMARLDLDTSFAHAVTLVEWAERLADAGLLPVQRLDVQIAVLASQEDNAREAAGSEEDEEMDEEDVSGDRRARQLTLVAHGDQWMERVKWLKQHMLDESHHITVSSE